MGEIEAARRFFEPSEGEHRRMVERRQNKHVMCPLHSHKDSILGLRSCLASSQNPYNLDLNLDTEMLLHASISVLIRLRKGGQIGMAVGILSDEYDIKSI